MHRSPAACVMRAFSSSVKALPATSTFMAAAILTSRSLMLRIWAAIDVASDAMLLLRKGSSQNLRDSKKAEHPFICCIVWSIVPDQQIHTHSVQT